MKKERVLLLDRLALIGLGSPLYSAPVKKDEEPTETTEPIVADPDRELMERLMRLRRRPARLADQLTRQYRDSRKLGLRPGAGNTAPATSEIAASLAHAEDLGREIGKVRSQQGSDE